MMIGSIHHRHSRPRMPEMPAKGQAAEAGAEHKNLRGLLF
jgi:hypothetical protein